eukprot:scaffold9211_cov127-Isochrysis_galbana.AAC.2
MAAQPHSVDPSTRTHRDPRPERDPRDHTPVHHRGRSMSRERVRPAQNIAPSVATLQAARLCC